MLPAMARALLLGLGSLLLLGCAGKPPAGWVKGGAPLDVVPSRWVRGDFTIEIERDGKIIARNSYGNTTEHLLSIDRGGRVFDVDAKPVALLEPDGRVIGPGETSMGFVGAWSAALPNEQLAWLAIMNTGEVVHFREQGERIPMGVWVGGCNYSLRAHQMCVLVTHVLAMKWREDRPAGYQPGMYPPGMYPPGYTPGMGYPGAGLGGGL